MRPDRYSYKWADSERRSPKLRGGATKIRTGAARDSRITAMTAALSFWMAVFRVAISLSATQMKMVATQPIMAWHAVIGEPISADAILDRIAHDAYRLEFERQPMRKTVGRTDDETSQA